MILSKMLKQCKKNKRIQIVRYGGRDYLSDGRVAGYIDADVEDWTDEDCAAAIGIPADERDKYILPPEQFSDFANYMDAAPMEYSIATECGTIFKPFRLTNGCVFFINAELLKIFDEVRDKRYYFKASDRGGMLLVAQDRFVVGVICPTCVNLNNMSVYAAELLRGLNVSEMTGFFDAGGQMEIIEPVEAESDGAE